MLLGPMTGLRSPANKPTGIFLVTGLNRFLKSAQPVLKGSEREADHYPSSTADVKIRGGLPPFLHAYL